MHFYWQWFVNAISYYIILGAYEDGGAGITQFVQQVTYRDCKFTKNIAGIDGGAIASNNDYSLDLFGCVFLQNEANFGGAVCFII